MKRILVNQEGRGKGMPGRGNLRGNGWEVGACRVGFCLCIPSCLVSG